MDRIAFCLMVSLHMSDKIAYPIIIVEYPPNPMIIWAIAMIAMTLV